MTIEWIHRTFICRASEVAAARNMADCIDPAAAGMFARPLSATGLPPATHYISSGMVEDLWAPIFYTETIDEETGEITRTKTPPEHLYAACQAGAAAQDKVLTATLQDASDLLEYGDVSDEAPFTAMARLGLQFVQEEPEA